MFTPSATHTTQGVSGTAIENIFPKDGKSFVSDVTSESILLSIRKEGKEGKVVVKVESTAIASEKTAVREKSEKKEKVVAAVPGIEEIRVARVNKLAAMREAGNVSILSAISSMIPKYI